MDTNKINTIKLKVNGLRMLQILTMELQSVEQEQVNDGFCWYIEYPIHNTDTDTTKMEQTAIGYNQHLNKLFLSPDVSRAKEIIKTDNYTNISEMARILEIDTYVLNTIEAL